MSSLPSNDWFEALPDLAGILDPTGSLVAANHHWKESTPWRSLLGPGWTLGGNLLSALESSDSDHADLLVELAVGIRSVSCGRLDRFEKQFALRQDKVRSWFLCRVNRIKPAAGVLIILSIVRPGDADSEALKVLAAHAREGQLILQDDRIVFANPAFSRWTGFSVPELLRKTRDHLVSLVVEQDRSAFELALYEATTKLGRDVPVRFKILDREGIVRSLDARTSVIEFQGRVALQLSVLEQTGPPE